MSRTFARLKSPQGLLTMLCGPYNGWTSTPLTFSSAPPTFPETGYNVRAINDSGDVVGEYADSSLSHNGVAVIHGFVDAGSNFTKIDFPGAVSTWATGIQQCR